MKNQSKGVEPGRRETDPEEKNLVWIDLSEGQGNPSYGQAPETGNRKAGNRQAGNGKAANRKTGNGKAANRKTGNGKTGSGKAGNQKTGKKGGLIAGICCLLLLAAGGVFYYLLPHLCVKEALTLEAGMPCPETADFLKWQCEDVSLVSGIDESMEFDSVQDYSVVLHLYHQDVATVLHVTDTVAPKVRTKDVSIMLGESVAAEDFVESVEDVTACRIFYGGGPDLETPGQQTVTVDVEDEGGNLTRAEAALEILQDVTPPVIEGVQELTAEVGGSVSYKKGVTVTDDYDDEVTFTVDHSAVNLNEPGDYPVVYAAADKYGNETRVETTLHVRKPRPIPAGGGGLPVTEETVNAEADKVLASITNPDMTQYEILKAIYEWCHSQIAFVDEAPKDDWVTGAYYGLILRKGDCFAYAMTAKCLLTRAGIPNMDIQRIPHGDSCHYWNLVDIGEGWRHFDTCRRADGSTFFYLTDAELMEYSNAHTGRNYPDGTHYYDRSLYPEIP